MSSSGSRSLPRTMPGFMIVLWATPTMTVGYLLFASFTTAYIPVGVRLEERGIATQLPGYAEYATYIPRFFPARCTGNPVD